MLCAICFKLDDYYQLEAKVQWIECTECSSWEHQACASIHLWCHPLIWKIIGVSIVKEPVLDLQLTPSNDPEI